MAIRGRKSAERGVSNNRHAPVHQWIDVEDVPFTGGPELPSRRGSGQRWSADMGQRWAAWSSMPHCLLWKPSDWQFALDTLEVAARFNDSERTSWSAELRHREKVMGTNYDGRQGMRIRYVEQADAVPTPVLAMDDYRDL